MHKFSIEEPTKTVKKFWIRNTVFSFSGLNFGLNRFKQVLTLYIGNNNCKQFWSSKDTK